MVKNNLFQQIEVIYEAHYLYLKNFLIGLTKNDALAEDIIQELFAKILTSPNRILEVTYMKSWLVQSAKNTLIDHYRKKKPSLLKDNEVIESLLINHFTPEEATVQSEQLASLLDTLSTREKAILLAKEYYGYSYEEMSELFNLPVPTLKSRIFRMKKKFIARRDSHER